ncbi:hypothetical protein EDB80DRAFT_870323 [Ilyonectria destructans]|nr:hypothetical protein EDB80DRAFT_870323 [Ilyonectria destructans]
MAACDAGAIPRRQTDERSLLLVLGYGSSRLPSLLRRPTGVQNAAVLQMMEAAIAQAAVKSTPIRVHANPRTQNEALNNIYAFSDEGQVFRQAEAQRRRVPPPPFGLEGAVFQGLQDPEVDVVRQELHRPGSRVVEEGENDEAVVDDVDRFFWLAGFGPTISPSAKN